MFGTSAHLPEQVVATGSGKHTQIACTHDATPGQPPHITVWPQLFATGPQWPRHVSTSIFGAQQRPPAHTMLAQSPAPPQAFPSLHGGQPPPQSRSVSGPFFT